MFSVSFGSSAAIGITVVYTIDCYRPIAGEVLVSQVVFKCKLFTHLSNPEKPQMLTNYLSSFYHISHVLLRESMG